MKDPHRSNPHLCTLVSGNIQLIGRSFINIAIHDDEIQQVFSFVLARITRK